MDYILRSRNNFRNWKRKGFLVCGLLLFIVCSVFLKTEENSYGFERPMDYNEEDEDNDGDQANNTEFHLKVLSPALIEAKLHALSEGLNNLRSAPAKLPVINSTDRFTLITKILYRGKIHQKKICDRYYAESVLNRTVLISPWQSYNHYESDDVTMVAHMTIGKMNVLDMLLSFWPGPMSIAIDVIPQQIDTFLFALKTKYKDWVSRDNLDLHFIRRDGEYYPVNCLRQVAKKNIKTRFVFLNDIDFIPQSKLYRELKKLMDNVDTRKAVYVVPAFEFLTVNPESFPETRKDLFTEWEMGTIQPFRYDAHSLYGHIYTDYKKWISANKPYKIPWGVYYEPYIFAEAAYLPDYDTRFLGRYMDKISFLDKIAAIGFDFIVLPKLFIVHYFHPMDLDNSYEKCAEDLYHDIHFPAMRRLWKKRGVSPPKKMYTRPEKPSKI